ncbi:YncE family protein, partial [Ilumatobacter sp.]|uniref:YncE family protein n=1 Tax=Ilumatobacter sp. TaxID=1967498 RepID=UPI00375071FA
MRPDARSARLTQRHSPRRACPSEPRLAQRFPVTAYPQQRPPLRRSHRGRGATQRGRIEPAGPAGPLTSSCAATLRWDLPACQTATVTVKQDPRGVAFDGTYIWVANFGGETVSKIDPTNNSVTNIVVGTNPFGVAFDGTNIWVTN